MHCKDPENQLKNIPGIWNTGHWECSSGWQHSPQGERGGRETLWPDQINTLPRSRLANHPEEKKNPLVPSPGSVPLWHGVGLGHHAISSSLASISTALVWTVGSVTNHKLAGTHLELTHRRAHQSQASQGWAVHLPHNASSSLEAAMDMEGGLGGPRKQGTEGHGTEVSRPDG